MHRRYKRFTRKEGRAVFGVRFEALAGVARDLLEAGRHRRAGLKALRRYADASVPAEMAVSWAHRIWSGQRTTGRGLGPSPLPEDQLARALEALDDAHTRWTTLEEGETLTWSW